MLNERKIPTPSGGSWHSVTVIQLRATRRIDQIRKAQKQGLSRCLG
jgi:hypothetical protein